MKIFLTGGTGFIGSALTERFLKEGYEVTILTRKTVRKEREGVKFIRGNPLEKGKWQDEIVKHDVIINLAGAPIFRRWSSKYKRIIRDSRILTTMNVVNALKGGAEEKVLINASAVGYYGFHGDEVLTEKDKKGNDFLAELTDEWERTALKAKDYGTRVLLCRFGIVLGKGGMLERIIPAVKYNLISSQGSGMQWISWIHIKDLVEAILFLFEKNVEGAVNVTSPTPVRNKDFMRTIANVMGKRIVLPRVPGPILRIFLGEFSELILNGQKAYPERLLNQGYRFRFPELRSAIEDILKKN